MQKYYTDPQKGLYPFWFTKAAAAQKAKEEKPMPETQLPIFTYHTNSFIPDFCRVKHV